jgi:uncharacterized membrane protein YgdD (TMEM256/DUF423 family)
MMTAFHYTAQARYIHKMERILLAAGALLGFAAVAGGAFGAHALRGRLSAQMLEVFETAVRYQMYHALALVLTGVLLTRFFSTALSAAGWFFLAGVLIFSGSLYLMTFTGARWLGAITPIGGIAFLLGWLCLFWGSITGTAR